MEKRLLNLKMNQLILMIFELLANQILRVHFILDDDVNKKKYNMNFEA